MPVFVDEGVVGHLVVQMVTVRVQVGVVQEDEHPTPEAVGDFPAGYQARPEEEVPVPREHHQQQQPDGVLRDSPSPLDEDGEQDGDSFRSHIGLTQ